jgi:hypothetical protein
MAYVFGSGIDSVAQQKNYYDQMNVGLAQSDQAARQRAIDITQQRQLQTQQQAQDQANAQYQFQQQQAAQQQADQTNDFRFNLGRQDEASARAEDTRRFNVQTQLQKDQLASTKGQNDYAEAVNAIENGDVNNPDDLAKSFPNLNAQQQTRASMYLTMKAKKQTQDYQAVQAAADAATGLVASKPVTTTAKPHFWSSPVTTTTPAAPLSEDEAFAKLAPIKPLAKFLPALTWDEAAQRFVPAMPKPEWQPPGAMPGPVAQVSAGGPTLPPGQPMAGPAPFQFNPSATPQPTAVTSGPQPLAPAPQAGRGSPNDPLGLFSQ